MAASSANVFEHLGINVQLINLPTKAAQEKLKAGEIDAVVDWDPYPDQTMLDFKNDGRFHLIAVPYPKELQSVYNPASFPADTYPRLVPPGQKLETVSLNAVIAAYNWPKNSDRYKRVARFAEQLFSHFRDLQAPGRDSIWKGVNPFGIAVGWRRFPAAQEWVDANVAHPPNTGADPSISEFSAFLKDSGRSSVTASPAEEQKLFEAFVAWRKARAANAQP